VAEWCGVENSARETKRRRGAQKSGGEGRGTFNHGRKRTKRRREKERTAWAQ